MAYKDPEKARSRLNAKARAYRAAHPDKIRARNRAWYEANRELSKAKSKLYYHSHKEQARAAGLRYRHGLTIEAYESMLAGQGGACAICGTSEWGSSGPHVDHDHSTGDIRGILCQTCNIGLGHLGDCVETIKVALDYLEKSRINSDPGAGAKNG
jgi:hypothetical protein